MITKDSIETAYSFLHQIAIASYADEMSQELLDVISGGRADFLRDHKRFKKDITKAVKILENMI